MKYIIFGIPGVGKTSVVEGVIARTGIKHIHWGDLTVEVAAEMKIIKDRDEIRNLNIEKQKEIRKVVAKKIFDISQTEKNILVETHAAVKTPQGYWPGLSIRTLERFTPDVFIVLSASPELIFERRLKDESRWRKDEVTIESVNEALNITREVVVTYAVLTSGTFIEVENKLDDLNYAINIISELIEKGEQSQFKIKDPVI
jgi:adenylate kinase